MQVSDGMLDMMADSQTVDVVPLIPAVRNRFVCFSLGACSKAPLDNVLFTQPPARATKLLVPTPQNQMTTIIEHNVIV